jgi:hypothetical protein
MVRDAQGAIHLAGYTWAGSGVDSVLYSRLDSSGWHEERIGHGRLGLTDGALERVAITADQQGVPHVAYFDQYPGGGESDGRLIHAWRDNDSWHTEVVQEHGGFGASVGVGRDGSPIVTYIDKSGVRFARRTSNGWLAETITAPRPNSEDGFFHTSLAVDGSGRPHVAFDRRGRPPGVTVRWRAGRPVIRKDGVVGTMGWEDLENPWFGFVEYARRDETGWHILSVEESPDVGLSSALTLDRAGEPLIAYSRVENGDLERARSSVLLFAELRDGAWRKTEVETGEGVRVDLAIAVDSSGLPRVAYALGRSLDGEPEIRIMLASRKPRRSRT